MAKNDKNSNLHAARNAKNDEFYTQITDIEIELKHYKELLKDKIIFCNCDDPEWSNFWKYFYLNFNHLGLKKLVSTHFEAEKPSYKLEYDGVKIVKTQLSQNGDFRSPEAIEILKECDIVVTNPPFSLFREYVAQLIEYDKKFLIIGNLNAVTYKEVFSLIKANKIWTGCNEKAGTRKGNTMLFTVSKSYTSNSLITDENGNRFAQVSAWWFTNLDHKKRHESLILTEMYTPEKYPKYDNYDVINVNKTLDIPCNYDGVMGVPITFLDKYCPDQFEILGIANSARWIDYECLTLIDGNKKYNRLIIKAKE